MPKRKEPEIDPAEQYQRFREAAKKAGLTEDEREVEQNFKKIARPAPPRKPPIKRKR